MSSSKTIHGHLQPFCSHFHRILDGFWICLGPNHSNVNTRSKNTLKNGRLLNAHWIYSMYLIMIKHLPNIGSGWPSGLRRQSKAQKSFWGAWFESRRASNEIYKIFFFQLETKNIQVPVAILNHFINYEFTVFRYYEEKLTLLHSREK